MPFGHVPDGDRRADSHGVSADVVPGEAERGPRSRQADTHVYSAVGVFQLLATAHHLGGKPADGNPLLRAETVLRLADHRTRPGHLPFCDSVPVPAFAAI